VYTITLFGPTQPGATKTTEQAELPCGAVPGSSTARPFQLAGHASVSYHITLKIPANAAPSVYKLYWLSSSFPGTEAGTVIKIG